MVLEKLCGLYRKKTGDRTYFSGTLPSGSYLNVFPTARSNERMPVLEAYIYGSNRDLEIKPEDLEPSEEQGIKLKEYQLPERYNSKSRY